MLKKYKKNYISNFLIRLDLETGFNNEDYDKLISLLVKDFPINERRDIQNRNVIFSKLDKENSKSMLLEPKLMVQNILYDTSRTNRVTINNNSIIYESLHYISYTNVKTILEKIIDCLNKDYGIKNFSRIDLRYVNLIKIPIKEKKQIFDWDGYINEKILFDSSFIENDSLLQEIKSIDFKLDKENDLLCRLQVGIPNRNMPADLMEKVYLIDIDGYTDSLVEYNCAMEILDLIHDKNIMVFEKCICDKLRGDMNE